MSEKIVKSINVLKRIRELAAVPRYGTPVGKKLHEIAPGIFA